MQPMYGIVLKALHPETMEVLAEVVVIQHHDRLWAEKIIETSYTVPKIVKTHAFLTALYSFPVSISISMRHPVANTAPATPIPETGAKEIDRILRGEDAKDAT